MGLLNNLRDPVVVLRAAGADEYGNPGRSWDAPTEASYLGFQASQEVLILPANADVRAGDRVRVNGVLFAVAGEPVAARSPLSVRAMVVRLEAFTDA